MEADREELRALATGGNLNTQAAIALNKETVDYRDMLFAVLAEKIGLNTKQGQGVTSTARGILNIVQKIKNVSAKTVLNSLLKSPTDSVMAKYLIMRHGKKQVAKTVDEIMNDADFNVRIMARVWTESTWLKLFQLIDES